MQPKLKLHREDYVIANVWALGEPDKNPDYFYSFDTNQIPIHTGFGEQALDFIKRVVTEERKTGAPISIRNGHSEHKEGTRQLLLDELIRVYQDSVDVSINEREAA